MDADGERWFEDFAPGLVIESGGATLSEAAILDFALLWDPQPFHIDRAAAEAGPYGGVIASGFHTAVVAFRLWITAARVAKSSIGSPGIEELKWSAPVRPGMTIRCRGEVVSARASASRPDRGFATIAMTVREDGGTTVMDYRYVHMLLKRPASG